MAPDMCSLTVGVSFTRSQGQSYPLPQGRACGPSVQNGEQQVGLKEDQYGSQGDER